MKIIENIKKVSESLDADIFMFNGGMTSPADEEMAKCLRQFAKKPNVMLMLSTYGGSADVAYRIARCLQRQYKDGKFVVFVCSSCKSAGTLLTLGANELVMTDDGQLGPLDVQLARPDELADVISGLTPVQGLDFLAQKSFSLFEHHFLELVTRSGRRITTKTAAEIATRIATGLFEPVYAQLDPIRLGEYHRDMLVAFHYGMRLAKRSNNLKDGSIQSLTDDYPSHSFVIDRDEAEELFNNVRKPTDNEQELANKLASIINEHVADPVATIMYLPTEGDEKKPEAKDATETEEGDGDDKGTTSPDRASEDQGQQDTAGSNNGDQAAPQEVSAGSN